MKGVKRFVRTINHDLLQWNMATSIYQQRMVDRRKANGLCVNCGKPLDRDGVVCIACRQKRNQTDRGRRHWYQDNGICPRCGAVSLMGDERVCPECNAKIANLAAKRREENREEYNEKQRVIQKNIYARREAQGICARCGKRKADPGYKTCGICRAKLRNYKRIKKYQNLDRRDRPEQGLCYFCDNPVKEGYKVCEKHYQMNLQKLSSEECINASKRIKAVEHRLIESRQEARDGKNLSGR